MENYSKICSVVGYQSSELPDETPAFRDVTGDAVWSVSSYKAGHGVKILRDSNKGTFWQSEGAQPHLVNVQFRRKTLLKELWIYMDYGSDESYTPSKISFRVGSCYSDLKEIKCVHLQEPQGWVQVPLSLPLSSETKTDDVTSFPVKTFMVQLAIIQNHQSGRDSHLRLIKIYGCTSEKSMAQETFQRRIEKQQKLQGIKRRMRNNIDVILNDDSFNSYINYTTDGGGGEPYTFVNNENVPPILRATTRNTNNNTDTTVGLTDGNNRSTTKGVDVIELPYPVTFSTVKFGQFSCLR